MPLEIVCESCGCRLRVQDESAGQRVKCPNCSAVMEADAVRDTLAPKSPPAPAGTRPEPTEDPNPYASPRTPGQHRLPGQHTGEPAVLTPGIYRAMAETRPWVLFLSVLGFIIAGVMVLFCLSMAWMSLVSGAPGVFLVWPVVYLLYAVIYFAGAYYLLLYGRRIGSFRLTNQIHDLEAALVAQKSFWKLIGIITAIALTLAILMILGFVLLPILMQAGRGV
jgi:hypothetical protein